LPQPSSTLYLAVLSSLPASNSSGVAVSGPGTGATSGRRHRRRLAAIVLGRRSGVRLRFGLTAPDETRQCLEHASRCDDCGPGCCEKAVSELGDLNRESTARKKEKRSHPLKAQARKWQEDWPGASRGQRMRRRIGVWAVVAEVAERPRMAMVGRHFLPWFALGSWFAVHSGARLRRHSTRRPPRKLLAQAYTQENGRGN